VTQGLQQEMAAGRQKAAQEAAQASMPPSPPDEDPHGQQDAPPPAAAPMRSRPRPNSPRAKKHRHRRGKRRFKQALEIARRAGVVTPSGACCGVGDDHPIDAPNNNITFDFYKTGNGFSAVLRLPTEHAGKVLMARSSPSATKEEAAKKSVNMASKLLKSPAIASLVPPQAHAAMAVMKSPVGKLAVKHIGRFLR
jgi:hypothetical protein